MNRQTVETKLGIYAPPGGTRLIYVTATYPLPLTAETHPWTERSNAFFSIPPPSGRTRCARLHLDVRWYAEGDYFFPHTILETIENYIIGIFLVSLFLWLEVVASQIRREERSKQARLNEWRINKSREWGISSKPEIFWKERRKRKKSGR